jgi:hypothetical protein
VRHGEIERATQGGEISPADHTHRRAVCIEISLGEWELRS